MAADRMNHLSVGTLNTDWLTDHAQSPYLLIADPSIANAFTRTKRARVFDPFKHSFDPLLAMDYPKACAFVEILRYLFPAGETTLTREEADHLILEALLAKPKPKKLSTLIPAGNDPAQKKARRLIQRLLLSPVLKHVLTGTRQFDFSGSVVVKLDRAKLGNFDALALALLLIAQSPGQVIVQDFVFYGRPLHVSLIEQGRLTCHVRRLNALYKGMDDEVLRIEDKTVQTAAHTDVVVLADYMCPFRPGQDGYNTFIDRGMA
jgi:hypothetical protein